MSRNKMTQNCGFRESCKTFYRMKGVVQPTCGCGACWSHYFHKNPTKVAAASLALKTFGAQVVVWAQGKDFALALEQREAFEIRYGILRHPSDYFEAAVRRGTKYLKHLAIFLRDNPHHSHAHTPAVETEGKLYADNNFLGNVKDMQVNA